MIRSESKERDRRTYAIIGAAMEVHQQLGSGFLEAVYHEAPALELAVREVPYRWEVELPVFNKAQKLKSPYRADFACFDPVIVEVKALAGLSGTEESQMINYLKAQAAKSDCCSTLARKDFSTRDLSFNLRYLCNLWIH